MNNLNISSRTITTENSQQFFGRYANRNAIFLEACKNNNEEVVNQLLNDQTFDPSFPDN